MKEIDVVNSSIHQRNKGVIILSQGRSGTNWLKSISNATGQMGKTEEWLSFNKLSKPIKSYSTQSFYDHALQNASTENGRFSLKIFPRDMHLTRESFGLDFVRKCMQEQDVKLYLLTREDRVLQAISRLKSDQTNIWHAQEGQAQKEPQRQLRYNFRKLCLYYFEIGRQFEFWRSYLAINQFEHETFTYESLLPNPAPFFESTAKHLDVPPPTRYESAFKIQRDAITEDWCQRFSEDIKAHGVHPGTYHLRQPNATLSNALKLLTGRPFKAPGGWY